MATTQTAKAAPKGTKSQKLEDQAATAALYVTGNQKKESKGTYPLDADGKLSSASAATSLKHAQPRDLPSFPVVGINQESSAGAAASLAAANQKPFEHWKPEYSEPANKAALLAKDYKMDPLWQPEASAAGSKAALLAAKNSQGVNPWRPGEMPESDSAAGQAMRAKGLSPNVDYGYTKAGSDRALLAATGAMSGKFRQAPPPAKGPLYPDAANSAANALKAATAAHKPAAQTSPPAPTDLPGLSPSDATRIHNAAVTNMGKEMYTSNPPVAPEVEERNRDAGLRAAAITMASAMYKKEEQARKNRSNNASLQAATNVSNRGTTDHDAQVKKAAQGYLGLQEAAQKLAAERLAKLRDENAEYREYYGAHSSQQKSRLSVRGGRRRSSVSDNNDSDDEDRHQSRRIRNQMSGLNKQLAEVDTKKRQQDRNSLLEVARRNVDKSMKGMDEKVFQQTGKPSPAMEAEWDAKARAKAEAESSSRLQNHGKVDIGGGKYMDQSEIDAIAAGRVQPTLDEVTQTAEERRARDEERRQAAEDARRLREEKVADDKERNDKTKSEWKRFKAEEKEEARQKKAAEKAEKEAEQRRRDEQLKELNEKDIQRPSDRDKRKSGLSNFGTIFKNKRKSQQPEPSSATTPKVAAVAPGVESRRSSTSLDSSSDERDGVAAATRSSEVQDKGKQPERIPSISDTNDVEAAASGPAAGTATATTLPNPPKPIEPVQDRIAIPIGKGQNETTVTGGTKKEDTSDKDTSKKASWFKRLSKRSSKPPKVDEKTAQDLRSVEEKDAKDKNIVVEPTTGLPMDTSKENPGFGTDEIPHIAPQPDTTSSGLAATSATINPATDSAISPAEADAVQAKSTFDEDNSKTLGNSQHIPTAPNTTAGEFLPLKLLPQGDHSRNDSERDVALAGKTNVERSRSTSLSSMSSDAPTTKGRGRSGHAEASDPVKDSVEGTVLGREETNESTTGEDFQEAQEAQDTLNTADLPLPAFQQTRPSGESPHRETRFREEL